MASSFRVCFRSDCVRFEIIWARVSHDCVCVRWQELCAFAPQRCWRLVEVDATLEDVEEHQAHLLGQCTPPGA